MAETLCVCWGGFEKLVRSRGGHKIWLQGSILRPLLFNIYVNSLPNAVKNARVILYADDAVLICTASTSVVPQAILVRDFNWICDWYNENKLDINVKKNKLMLARSKTMFSLFDDVDFQMNGTQVESVQSCNLLKKLRSSSVFV